MKKKCERNVIVVIHFDVHSPSVSTDFDVVRARSLFPRGLDLDAVSTFVCVEICIKK